MAETPHSWHPLPSNYAELSPPEQQRARIEAVARCGSPTEFVAAWVLFRELYLFTTPPGQFYPNGVLESPPAHYEWIQDFATYSRNIFGAPRASAKSIVIGKELPLMRALTVPYSRTMLLLANNSLVEERISELMLQLEGNDGILSDFGKMKPSKGAAIWNRHHLTLNNGSVIYGISVEARKRGPRPSLIILDDPEYDPEIEGNDTQLSRALYRLLFRQLLPMLEEDCSFMWIGTMISRRSALWRACMGDDPRFEYWNRRVYSKVHYDSKGKARYFWPQKWDASSIARERRELGEAAFQAESQNNPVSDQDRLLHLHPKFNYYLISGQKVQFESPSPSGGSEVNELDFQEWLAGLTILTVTDPAATTTATADFSYLLTVGIDKDDCWWILDGFQGRMSDARLLDELFRVGSEWQPWLIGIESIAFQDKLRQWIDTELSRRLAGKTWQPRVWPIKYSRKLSKSARIEALSPRLSRHMLRIPSHLRGQEAIAALIAQIEDFTPDLALLPYDDGVDCLAMIPYCPRSGGRGPVGRADESREESIVRQLREGRLSDEETGLPLGSFLDISHLSPAVMQVIRGDQVAQSQHQRAVEKNWSPQEQLKKMGSALMDKPVKIEDTRLRSILLGDTE